MGILAGIEDEDTPLNILLAKQHHIENAEFEDLKEGDNINIRVLGKKYEFGDSQIAIIGLLENEYIKQNQMLEEDDDDEDIEQLSNQGTIDSLSFKNSASDNEISIPESMPDLLTPEDVDKGVEGEGQEQGNDDDDIDDITLKPEV